MNRQYKSICFITTGDIKSVATAKRALGLANPLSDLGWDVSIIMLDTEENRNRISIECDEKIKVYYIPESPSVKERKIKNRILKMLKPDIIYICAFVGRNIVGLSQSALRLVEHCELQSRFKESSGFRKLYYYCCEFFSIIYADGLLNASVYLQTVYKRRASSLFKGDLPMLHFPYAYSERVCYLKDGTSLQEAKPKGNKYFVFLGSLVRNYGVFTMIAAFEKIRRHTSCLKLFLLGRGGDFEEVVKYIDSHDLRDTVVTPGYIAEKEVADYFSVADAFLLPLNNSIQDWARCPSKFYMYLAYNKPIVTCRIGEPYYELQDKGSYYIAADADSLAETIMRLSNNSDWSLDINPDLYTWKYRAKELVDWIGQEFIDK